MRLAPGAVTVLDPGALERFQTPDLRSALQTVPGVNVLNLGAPGSLSKINIRGAGATHTLLLVDGIRVNSQDDTNSYANLLGAGGLEGLGRLEVLRGPQSVLYGSS
ncbi:MAG: TonB-dependent receptor plug domain-containing protein, partial [Opitutaceae bacterium]|nr:TonB-dependent receptor plug domain-containing protein [Opitutaceae bacterium]